MGFLQPLFATLCVALIGCSASSDADATAQSHNEDAELIQDSLLAESVAEANKRLPRDIENSTRIDYLSTGPGRRITFHLTLTNRTAKDVTPAKISAGRDTLVEAACNSESVKYFLSDGIGVTYTYKTSDGIDFTSLDVTETLCASVDDT